MEFKKYSSIENSYRTKYIDTFEKHYTGDIRNIAYVAREKLDGANIQLVITKDGLQKVGKRSQFIGEGDNFFDIWNTLKKYETEIAALAKFVQDEGMDFLRVFGEIYGPGINGRINYGPDKKIAFFDMYIVDPSGEYLCAQRKLEEFFEKLNISHMLPPLFGRFDNLDQAMAFDVENNEVLTNKAGDYIEGVVIQTYDAVARTGNGERFLLKKKSKKFEDDRVDKINSGAGKAEPKERDALYDLNKIFISYCSKNRVIDTFAKHGEIKSPQEIGKYIQLVLDDAKIDFLKENEVPPNLDKKQEKSLYNVGGKIVEILKEYL